MDDRRRGDGRRRRIAARRQPTTAWQQPDRQTPDLGNRIFAQHGNIHRFRADRGVLQRGDSNSGVFSRRPTTNPNGLGGYEINISDPHATSPTGSIVGVHSTLPYHIKAAGKWSRFDIVAEGPHLVVKVNGETLTDANDNKLTDGALGFQAGGPTGSGVIKFRNIKVRPLKK